MKMVLDEHDSADKINAYTLRDWQSLLALIPIIETTSIFGEWCGGDKSKGGYIQLP